jgi:hypothetical protein
MGTELLKEQYNFLVNDQKTKLQKLKQKKQMMNQSNVEHIYFLKRRKKINISLYLEHSKT